MKSIFHLCSLIIIVVLVSCMSCNYCELWGVTSMGNNFSIVESDKDNVAINYCTSKCCDSGIPIIPSNVIEYNYNSKWIIAKSTNLTTNTYWLIDKNFKVEFEYDNGMREKIMKHVVGPVDSLHFHKEIEENKIDLVLKKYKSLQ